MCGCLRVSRGIGVGRGRSALDGRGGTAPDVPGTRHSSPISDQHTPPNGAACTYSSLDLRRTRVVCRHQRYCLGLWGAALIHAPLQFLSPAPRPPPALACLSGPARARCSMLYGWLPGRSALRLQPCTDPMVPHAPKTNWAGSGASLEHPAGAGPPASVSVTEQDPLTQHLPSTIGPN